MYELRFKPQEIEGKQALFVVNLPENAMPNGSRAGDSKQVYEGDVHIQI